jgi:hypothetical protein
MPPIKVRLPARRPAEHLMWARWLEGLKTEGAEAFQNAFCVAVGDRARHRYPLAAVRAPFWPDLCLPVGRLPRRVLFGFTDKSIFCPGICLASWVRVPDQLVYDAPTVMWRMHRGDGLLLSHAVISPRADGAVVTWFLNGHKLGSRVFNDWTTALRWSDQLQAQNWKLGWRLVQEYDDTPGRE